MIDMVDRPIQEYIMNFTNELKTHLEAEPHLRLGGKKILEIIYSPDSPRRTRQMKAMERYSAAAIHEHLHAARGKDGIIDWSAIDWTAFIQTILNVLVALMPFILTIL